MESFASTDRSSVRQQRLLSDIDLIIRVCSADKNNPFCQFEFENDSFSFEYRSDATRVFYKISLSDSYPDHSIMMSYVDASEDEQEMTYFSERLPVLFSKLAAKMYKPLELEMAGNRELNTGTAVAGDNDSVASGCDADDCDDDPIDAADDYDESDNTLCINSDLLKDIESVKTACGADSINYRYWSAIGDVDIKLFIPTNSLDAQVSEAWNIVHQQPIVISLHMSVSRYRNGQVPAVEVLQYTVEGAKKKSGIHKQMEKNLERFIAENWEKQSCSVPNPSPLVPNDGFQQLHLDGFRSRSDVSIQAWDTCQGDVGDNAATKAEIQPPPKRLKLEPTEKNVPSSDGFFVQLMSYAAKRLPTLNEFCVICDQPHLFEISSMLKPALCHRDLCVFAFQTLGVMAEHLLTLQKCDEKMSPSD